MQNLNTSTSHRRQSNSWKKHKIMLGIVVAFLIILFLWIKLSSSSVFNFVFGSGSGLEHNDGRVNVLLLGIGGPNHEGPNLTDTIMVASYDIKTKRADLISLPRDLWVEEQKLKVNGLYQRGLSQGGNGLGFVEQQIGKLVGLEIPYAVRIDFNGFIKAVDLVDGLDLTIEKTFDDPEYPITGKENDLCGWTEEQIEVDESKSKELNIPQGKQKIFTKSGQPVATESAQLDLGCRYETLHFTKGPTHMNGETALKFVRSRHGNNGEGSDFARSRRQQLVIESFRSKILSLDTLTDFQKMVGLVRTLGESVSTDIPQTQYLEFANMVKQVEKTTTHVIDFNPNNNLLINPPTKDYGGAWVLIPPNNDFDPIHKYVKDILDGIEPTPSVTPSSTARPSSLPKVSASPVSKLKP
jgi:polyisoprenyl-teichoic acid--peptidoglycan teichoic acid transferase